MDESFDRGGVVPIQTVKTLRCRTSRNGGYAQTTGPTPQNRTTDGYIGLIGVQAQSNGYLEGGVVLVGDQRPPLGDLLGGVVSGEHVPISTPRTERMKPLEAVKYRPVYVRT